MGLFDSFIGYWKCPDCHRESEIEVQTKQLEGIMNTYHVGDEIIQNYITTEPSYLIEEAYSCIDCSTTLQDVFGDGQLQSRVCKSKYKVWEVIIEIEDNRYKEMVFTGKWEWLKVRRLT